MRALLIFTLIFFLAACVTSPLTTPAQLIDSPTIPPASVSPTTIADTSVPPSATLSPTSEPTATLLPPTLPFTPLPVTDDLPTPLVSGDLWLQILSPLDEAVVNLPQVSIEGRAPAETVLSINDEILIVGDDQQFKILLALEEGPSLIEILASDLQGNQISLTLTVIFEP